MAASHLCLNAILLWLGYYWLGIGESRTGLLLWSLWVAVITLILMSWTYGTAFIYFPNRQLATSFRTAFRHLLPIFLFVIGIVFVYWLLSRVADYSTKPAFQMASYLTQHLRKPIRPSSMGILFKAVLWLIGWVLIPVFLAPLFSSVAAQGWTGFRSFRFRKAPPRYWLEVPLLLLCALWLPLKLLGWVPHLDGFALEALSFTLRAGFAYLLFIAGMLALAFVTSRGKPDPTQVSTTASP
jgi:hypothetical protein